MLDRPHHRGWPGGSTTAMRRPRKFALDPPPNDWLREAENRIAMLPLCLVQFEAASQLLRGLECLDLPTPVVNGDVRDGFRVASLLWCHGPRAVIAVPFALPPTGPGRDNRLCAALGLHDGGAEVWSGTRFAPVPMLRGMLGWVYGGRTT